MRKFLYVVSMLLGVHGALQVSAQEQASTRGLEERRNSRGVLQYRAIDSNGDGNFDTFYHYDANGNLERQEIDSKHSGKVDIIIHYIDGIYIASIEKDVDGDGSFRDKRSFN